MKSGKPLNYLKEIYEKEPYQLAQQAAQKQLENYFTSYNKLGANIATAYMVGITVGDTYGEAIEAGATDREAALLTAGYAAAEAALLKSDLGQWIFPELKGEKLKYTTIAKRLAQLPKETREMSRQLGRQDKETFKSWAKRLFNVGKEAAKDDYSLLNKSAKSIGASALAEGLEEVSEEALADFSKTCFNIYRDVSGQDKIFNTWFNNWDWNEAMTRYGMSFMGGILGGAINASATDFKQIRDYSSMNDRQAMNELVWMSRHGEIDNFLKTIDKVQLGDPNMGTKLNADGTFEVGTLNDNQDREAKKMIRNTIDFVQSVMQTEGVNMDDNGVIGQILQGSPKLKDYDLVGELRTNAIAKSVTMGKALKDYNNLVSEIVKLNLDIANLEKIRKVIVIKNQSKRKKMILLN